jgi:dienelactone hydrolase
MRLASATDGRAFVRISSIPLVAPLVTASRSGAARLRGCRLTVARCATIALALSVIGGCDGPPVGSDGGVPLARVAPRFEPTAGPIDFGAIPFPDDLYLDDGGHIALGAIPGEEQAAPESFPDSIRAALSELSGFSTVAPIYFFFAPRSLDPDSLPRTPAESAREDSPVFLVEIDSASPTQFRRIPVRAHWNAEAGQLALRPDDGHVLVPGRRYAAVVTSAVRDDEGAPIGPSARFRAIRDAASRPSDPIDGEAHDQYEPVLYTLASAGIPRESVAGLAVFTVQAVAPTLRDARALLREGDAPTVALDAVLSGAELDALLGTPELADTPGVDVPGGVAHRHIAWLVQGRFPSPSLLSEDEGAHGAFSRDAGGRLEVKRVSDVPFTLTLPSGDLSSLRVVVFQHGLGAERSEMFAVADALATAGWATIAIDIPFHGMRAQGAVVDVGHRFGDGEGPDGFGDRRGNDVNLEYLGVLDAEGPLPAFHPVYVRDVLRQSVVDLMMLVRVLREGDWSSLHAMTALSTVGFASEPLGFIGVSLGGIVGAIFVASEPEIGAAVLNVTGGDLSRLVESSAAFSDLFLTLLFPRLGIQDVDPVAYPPSFHPELALFQTLLDAGDSMSFAPALAAGQAELLFQMAEDDEVVPNRATEALARAVGGAIVGADPVHTDLTRLEAPLTGNVEVMARRVTRGLYRFSPATHGLLSSRAGEQGFAHPPEPPFTATDPVPVENPVDGAVEQVVHFLESWRGGGAEIVAPP